MRQEIRVWHWRSIPVIDDCRERRVGGLLGVVWLLGSSDLFFTLWAYRFTAFHELNPIARLMLQNQQFISLVLFKLLVMLFGTLMLWRVRRHASAELGLWLTMGVYVQLMFRWAAYTLTV